MTCSRLLRAQSNQNPSTTPLPSQKHSTADQYQRRIPIQILQGAAGQLRPPLTTPELTVAVSAAGSSMRLECDYNPNS
jgi:hypothetical protein